jgi:hypothetical protein
MESRMPPPNLSGPFFLQWPGQNRAAVEILSEKSADQYRSKPSESMTFRWIEIGKQKPHGVRK